MLRAVAPILLIDNYDSFTYNLYAYIKNLGIDVFVVKNDQLTLSQVTNINPIAIIISPGPCTPLDAGISLAVVATFARTIPILGICLGHQVIAYLFGGKICKGSKPMHGKVSFTHHNGDLLFNNIPNKFKCMRYHSLVIDISHSQHLSSIAEDENNVIMGIKHNVYNIYGLQFHPESILSTYGDVLLKNFINLCHKKGRY